MSSRPSVRQKEATEAVSPFWEARKSYPMSVGQEIRLDGWTRSHRYVRVRPAGKCCAGGGALCGARTGKNTCPWWRVAAVRVRTAGRSCSASGLGDAQAAAAAFRFLRHPIKPSAPRPEAISGRAAGTGTTDTSVRCQVPGVKLVALVKDPPEVSMALSEAP